MIETITTKKVTIRIDLDGEMAQKFSYLKNKSGLKTNADVVRLMITQKYDEDKKRELT